ncbi:unnamed protein product [Amoebophrya sp. A25]|nr:unnamed protein product [Amoebophrya sp. A25]|eukprot:GSA25T00021648001.1
MRRCLDGGDMIPPPALSSERTSGGLLLDEQNNCVSNILSQASTAAKIAKNTADSEAQARKSVNNSKEVCTSSKTRYLRYVPVSAGGSTCPKFPLLIYKDTTRAVRLA